jgi:hypothetical protein
MAKNHREFEIKRPGFAEGIKARIFKAPETMRRGRLR